MSDWDDNSPQLHANLARILAYASEDARRRVEPTLDATLKWHKDLMHGLDVLDKKYVGRFRGLPGLEGCQVGIAGYFGVRADLVPGQLKAFEQELQRRVKLLDAQIIPGWDPSGKDLSDVLKLCAWAHAEWIRIHPFANGNGRTARVWANYIAARYGLPPFVRLRPRPAGDFGD
jgi:Fic family protein